MNYLEDLNPAQREAATTTEGPLLIIAGAGAGKTKTLTYRIVHLIARGVSPERILAITFTNKAAREMRERVRAQMRHVLPGHTFEEEYAPTPFVSTFHALGVHILRNHGRHLGLTKFFSILDRSEALAQIKEAMRTHGCDPRSHEPRKIQNIISRQKGDLETPDTYEREHPHDPLPIASIWRTYEKRLTEAKAVDFDDLLVKTVTLLKEYPDVKEHYAALWQYIHVDEYQDTNHAQYTIMRLLADVHRNICVVGDADQNIYSWRGADIRNILDFDTIYPDAHTVTLEENYRSTRIILDAAHTVITNNTARKDKRLFTQNKEGSLLPVIAAANENEEASRIIGTIAELAESGVAYRDIAILYRANFQSRVLEQAMLDHGLPYQLLGTRFFDRKEVKDVLAYIKAALNPESDTDFVRVVNTPSRGIGKTTIARVLAGEEEKVSAAIKERLTAFRTLLTEIRRKAETLPPSELLTFILTESGLETALKTGTEEDQERLENIYELVTLASSYDAHEPAEEAVNAFLADAALTTDQDAFSPDDDSVKLMTVHAAKGLEFAHVFVTGLEDELFPHGGGQSPAEDLSRLEEERRLFYVALTRAKERAYLSHTSVRRIFGQQKLNAPSPFLNEIDPSFLTGDIHFPHGTQDEEELLPSIF